MSGNPPRSVLADRFRKTELHASRPQSSWFPDENPSFTNFPEQQQQSPPPPHTINVADQKNLSTPHPALNRYENKPLPPLNDGKRNKRNGIKTIGRFLRTFGKSPRPTIDPAVTQSGTTTTTVTEATTTTIAQSEPLFVPSSTGAKENDNHNRAIERPIIPKETLIFGTEQEEEEEEEEGEGFCPAEKQQEEGVCDNDNNNNNNNNNESNSLPPCNNNSAYALIRHSSECDLQQARPRIRRSLSADEITKRNNNNNTDVDELFEQEKHDSQIAGDRLSKRLSGNHYGSAGGLILSTLHFADQNSETPESIGLTAETSESDSVVAPATPPLSVVETDDSNNRNDDKQDDNQVHRQAMGVAKRIWDQDATVYTNFEHIVEWIGNGKPQSNLILKYYFLHFDFTNMRLDEAFRKLCSRLHLKAETQQIDRVLEAFAHRYWECNPHCIFGSQDVVHAIVYSLLLLNTDLHVAAGDHKKMSRSAFVRNTMNAIRAQCQQHEADDDMSSLTMQETDPRASNVTFRSMDSNVHGLKRTGSCKSSASNGSTNRSYGVTSLDIPSSTYLHGLTSKSRSWRMDIENALKEMYMSVRNRQILHPMSAEEKKAAVHVKQSRRQSLQIRAGAFKRNVGSVMWRSGRDSMAINETAAEAEFTPETSVSTGSVQRRRSKTSLSSSLSHSSQLTQHTTTTYQAVASLLHNPDIPNSYASGPPYYKEGLIIRKHLLERANQKARHREWKECFMVVDRGEIRMYKLDGSSTSDYKRATNGGTYMIRSGITMSQNNLADAFSRQHPPAVVGGGDWLANAEMVGQIDLKHTLSNTLPSGYSRHRPHAFALQQPNGGVYLFQGGSAEQVLEWVSTCNYWAARESKEPLSGGVSNLEYGWGACLEDVQEEDEQENKLYPPVQVQEWLPPMPPSVASYLEETAQLEVLHRHVKELNQELDKHRDIKRKMEIRFAPRSRAMINWENKSQYLLHEIIKYQNYCDAIENSLALQVKALSETNGGDGGGSLESK